MNVKGRAISPLILLLVSSALIVGGFAAWLWSSAPLTYDYVISGNVVATSNFQQVDLIGITSYNELKAACVSKILVHDSNYIIRVASNGGNIDAVYCSLEMTLPGATTATAAVNTMTYVNGVTGEGESLGSIAVDGSESVQVLFGGSATWFLSSDYSAGRVNVLYFLISISWDPSLPVGSHQATAIVRLGS